ncbi:phosphatidate cytidylyltransferase [Undibacterium sp. Jales W-56]|uniref:phosphatidate cytidylyltransferase n=1 Tax=Undibacterium sp. Jales W-56 TaxID=2897325 RepID=UPI0021CF74D5|nr:phosphatidate cytidylyltransferase [Undibacterium sp. Jales W-56]MCU6433610.1 phosphatidate cytidylyltransferase [Undibacterium sp. Jales W-56]
MLKTRVITALLLLAVLLPILYAGNFVAFAIVSTLFFAAAMWENQRLFGKPAPIVLAGIWTVLFAGIIFTQVAFSQLILFALCTAFWIAKLVPSLAFGLPAPNNRIGNALVSGMYSASIFACFIAITSLFNHSPQFLLSAMAVVWVADIGAYFSGKAFGKHKLAPGISPGKSWEGAIGGWIAVLVIGLAATQVSWLADTLPAKTFSAFGWIGFAGLMTLLTAGSVVGDLFESSLKRRAGVKDSSALLPGHGGVLDRIDALIPVLPLAALLDMWFK